MDTGHRIDDLTQLEKLRPLAGDADFRDEVRAAKHRTKVLIAGWLEQETGHTVNPDTLFDTQIKRQLLNARDIWQVEPCPDDPCETPD